MSHPIEGLMSTAMSNLKEMVDVNTIVGTPVESPDGSVIIPISKVSFGFAAGGSDFGKKNEAEVMFGGGSGGGVSIQPVGFIVVGQGQIKMMSVGAATSPVDRLLDMVPGIVDKINCAIETKRAEKKEKAKDKQDQTIKVEAVFED